jgi:hypothetical protein
VATDDLHAPLGLERPAPGRSIVYSVAAAVLGIATAAVVIGAAVWYEPLSHSLTMPAPPHVATPAVKPEPAVAVSPPVTPRVDISRTAAPLSRPLPQITGSVPPAGAAPDGAKDQPAASGSTDRIITIIDGRSGARQEVRIPATSDAENTPPPDPGLADLMRNVPDADEAPEPLPQPSHAKPSAPQKRTAKPGQTMSNSTSQAPLR